jgi:hypothetical protein
VFAVLIDDMEFALDLRCRIALGLKLFSVQFQSLRLGVVVIEELLHVNRLVHKPIPPEFVHLVVRWKRRNALLEFLDRGWL